MTTPAPVMLRLPAVSLCPAIHSWLQRRSAVSVLHIFDQACNLIADDGAILSLVTIAIGPGPFNVVTDMNEPFGRYVRPDTAVCMGQDHLIRLGPLTIDTAGAPVWQPRPPWRQLQRQPDSLRRWLPLLKTRLKASLIVSDNPVSAVLRRRLRSGAERFLHGVANGDMAACRAGARQLAGVGSGLTPAGDDFLLGAVYGLWATQPAEKVRPVAKLIAETAIPRTTVLSGAWLRAAQRGEAGQPWHDLVMGISAGVEVAVTAGVRRILTAGHTSGADALTGFVTVVAGEPAGVFG